MAEMRTRMERLVRIMLHFARSSDRLATLPLSRELCTILGMSNASTMLRSVVQSSFGDAPGERKLYQLVLNCDLDGTLTQSGAAQAMHVSRRQFHRLRTHAVAAIAGRIEWILDANNVDRNDALGVLAQTVAAVNPSAASAIYSIRGPSIPPGTKLMELRARTDAGELLTVDSLAIVDEGEYAAALSLLAQSQFLHGAQARDVDATAAEARRRLKTGQGSFDEVAQFELEFLSFLIYRARNDVASMRTSAARLNHAGASRRTLRERALAVNAETALRVGDCEAARALIADLRKEALHARDARALAIANLLTAQEYTLAGDYDGADEIAHAAALALERHRPEGVRAVTLLAGIRTMAGRDWEPSTLLGELEPESLDHVALSIAVARYLLASGNASGARAYAQPACSVAQRAGFVGSTAAALIVLGAAHDALGNAGEAQQCYAAGVHVFASVFDHVAASELFAIPGLPQRAFGPFARTQPIIDALVLRFAHVVPEVRDAADSSWHDLFASVLRDDCPRKNIAGEIGRYRPAVMRAFELGAAPVLPAMQRDAFLTTVEERLSQHLKTAK
jgi:tetratricopeptide (TPR) repeat protein